MVQVGSQKNLGRFIFLLSNFVNSQIWLNHLMEDCHLNYITKFKLKFLFKKIEVHLQFPLKFDFYIYWVSLMEILKCQ
jgi:hypothetical protein